ncbi:MAG TPA: PAS domain-containing protein, partial [Candidatus Angelobacter sp.]|nr:PAS domain-containing protein [Candidatus Angelobacter sp.]
MRTLPFDSPTLPDIAVDYAQLFRDFPEPCLLFEASGPDYRVIDINKARESMINARREDVVGKPLFSIMPYTDARFRSTIGKNLRRHLQRAIRTGRSYQLEPVSGVVWGMNGAKRKAYVQTSYMPLRDANDRVCYVLAVTREVTDELQADRRAQTIESRLNAALTIGKVGSWVSEVASGRVIGDANLVQMFKMTDEVAQNYTIDGFLTSIHRDDRARVAAAVAKSIAENVLFEEECRVRLADNSWRWILARGEPEGAAPDTTFSGVVVDLTEQRNLRAQVELAKEQDRMNRRAARILQQRNEELEGLSRSKDEFVALASHQLRTPATAVKQYVGMLLQGYVGTITDEQADVLQKAFDSNERQLQIIHQILNAARVDTGRLVMAPVPLDLKSLITGLTADIRSTIEQRQHTLV